MSSIRLVHDVLDAQLVDRHGEKIGRVDELTIELRDDRPPRVASILVGGPVRARRVGRWKVWLAGVMRHLLGIRKEGVDRIPFRRMQSIADAIELDVDYRDLASQHVEDWLADHVVCRIPGSRAPKQ